MRIGILHSSSLPDANIEALRSGLRQRGFVEGRHLIIEYRAADGKLERLPELATDLVRAKVDVIVTGRTAAIRAARDATTTIPIVFAGGADPVGTGLVASLARPGGNVTGVTTINVELTPKRLELLKETRSRSSSDNCDTSLGPRRVLDAGSGRNRRSWQRLLSDGRAASLLLGVEQVIDSRGRRLRAAHAALLVKETELELALVHHRDA